jgi:hypothetical protein
LLLYFLPLDRHYFAFTHSKFQILQFVKKFTRIVSSSEVINSFEDGVTHSGNILAHVIFLFHQLDRAACLLHTRIYLLFTDDSAPIIILEIKIDHIVCQRSVLELSSENDH